MSIGFQDYTDGCQYIEIRIPFQITRAQLICSLTLDYCCSSRDELATTAVSKDKALKSIRNNLWLNGIEFHYKAEDSPEHVREWATEQISRLFPR